MCDDGCHEVNCAQVLSSSHPHVCSDLLPHPSAPFPLSPDTGFGRAPPMGGESS